MEFATSRHLLVFENVDFPQLLVGFKLNCNKHEKIILLIVFWFYAAYFENVSHEKKQGKSVITKMYFEDVLYKSGMLLLRINEI